jgi:hypothetical protein
MLVSWGEHRDPKSSWDSRREQSHSRASGVDPENGLDLGLWNAQRVPSDLPQQENQQPQ